MEQELEMLAIEINEGEIKNRVIINGASEEDYDYMLEDLGDGIGEVLTDILSLLYPDLPRISLSMIEIDSIGEEDIVIPFSIITSLS